MEIKEYSEKYAKGISDVVLSNLYTINIYIPITINASNLFVVFNDINILLNINIKQRIIFLLSLVCHPALICT